MKLVSRNLGVNKLFKNEQSVPTVKKKVVVKKLQHWEHEFKINFLA